MDVDLLAEGAHIRFMRRIAMVRAPAISLFHKPEGNTVLASRVRGHTTSAAAKSIVVRVKLGKKSRRYVLAVVCGHRRVDLAAVARCFGGLEGRFAERDVAAELTGCVSGSIMPLSFHQDLSVVADVELLGQPCLYFNTGRLDHSVGMSVGLWLALAAPRIEHIADLSTIEIAPASDVVMS